MNKIKVTFLGLLLLPCLAVAETTEIGLKELFGKVGDQPGAFVLHLHCGDGASTGELLKREDVIAQGLDCNAENVAKARRNKVFRKDYGKRVTFNVFDGEHLPFIDNCANVILSSKEIKVSPHEIHRVLTPGGIAVFRSGAAPKISKALATVTMIKDSRYDGCYRLEKLWPPDIDEWTHHMHGPDNNRVANDTRIAPPLSHLQWTGAPRFTRHHEYMSSFQAMVSARGKVFYIMDEGRDDSIMLPPNWNLVARDGFNGIVLWRKSITGWVNHLWAFKSGPTTVTRRMVVQGDRLFVTLSITGGVSILDANSGEVLHTLPETAGAEEIIVDGERLFLVKRELLSESSKFQMKRQRRRTGAPTARPSIFNWTKETAGQSVMAFDVNTRKLLWQKEMPVAPFGLGSRDGNVYVFDGQRVLSLKADSGKENWKSAQVGPKRAVFAPNAGCSLVCGKGRILLGGAAGGNLVALSARDGAVVWKRPQYASGRHSPKDLFLINDVAWTASTFGASMTLPGVPSSARRKSGRITGYQLSDGAIVSDYYTDSDVYIMNSRCHMSCATVNYFITSRTGAELVSVKEEKWNLHHWLRGACLFGLMPANGMLYAPPNPCACYTQSNLDGFSAVTGHNPDWQTIVANHKAQGFVRGTAWSAKQTDHPGEVEANSWPAYRHDNKRSGSTVGTVAPSLAVKWRATGYEDLTAPVVAKGCCLFAEKDRHTVHCLDEKSGDKKWSYVAGGRIDSPPTISGNSIFFGCADGWLYRLLLSTGDVVWKRRIAPADLSLFDHGQPASVWPLSGSVLVQDGKVYCVAGRSSFLDGGMRLTVVDAESGKILVENVIDHRDPVNGKDMHQHAAMQNMPVALPDLLSSDGKNLYMLTQQFDLNGKRTHITNSAWDDTIKMGVGREHLFSATGFLDDNWFHRSYWVYGNSFLEGCSMPSGGWFEMGRISPSGKILCFDDTTVYGYGQFPEYSKWSTPLRYSLFAVGKKPKSYRGGIPDAELRKTRPNWRKYRTLRCPKVEFDFHWKSGVPLRAKAIVKTRNVLFVAGPEDLLDEESVFKGLQKEDNKKLLRRQNKLLDSRQGGKLLAVSVRDGVTKQAIDLASQPVWDGMAAAYGKLFVCCKDGSVVALGAGRTSQTNMEITKVQAGSPAGGKTKAQGRSRPESTSPTHARGAALFTEDFNAEISVKGRHRQAQTGLPVKHGYDAMPGWTRLGPKMPAHFVEQAAGDWALMVVANKANQNVFTQKKGFAANNKGHTYTVAFDVGPAVYQALSQTTAAKDQIAVELLRADATVLKKHLVKPGKWEGTTLFTNHTFSYIGDGSGPLRFRISPVYTSGTRFYGAIDNLQVFGSKTEAATAVRKRVADAQRAREASLKDKRKRARLLEQRTPLEKDWLFQAGNNPTVKHVQQEITWTRQLAERISKASEKLDLSAELKQLGDLERRLKDEAKGPSPGDLYFAVRRVKRAIAFKNPAVDFAKILLVDNPYPGHRHESAHRHGYRSGGKGRLMILEGLNPDSPVRSLVPEEKAGFLWRPDLSFDAKRIVFCLMPSGERSFHLYEVNADGTGFKQLTFGDYDDLDPIYLPDGKLLFNTTRANTYVRCGPTHHSPVLARSDADGKNIYVISRNCEPDYLPAMLPDGRVIYTRWEYTDKEQKRLQSLWTMNPDGTGVYAFWGNQSVWPDILAEPRPIPGSKRIMFTGVGHHMWFQGSIGIIDPSEGMNYPNGLSKVTSEIRWPEVGNGPKEKAATASYRPGRYGAYKTPHPISKEDFLVSILQPKTRKFSLYLMDLYGNRELIYSGRHNVWHAMPLKPRRRPPVIPDQVEWPKIGPNQRPLKEGVLYSANVFEGAPLLPKNKVKHLRVLQIDAKTYTPWRKTYQHSGPSISVTQADGVKRILGTTLVESDGSVCFKAPPGVALHFQLLDKEYRCIQTMRSFTGVMPGEVRGCVGCHEGRSSTPAKAAPGNVGLAMRRGPQALTPPPWGAEVSLGYERFVQPVLDKYCGKCHQGKGKGRKKLDLTLRESSLRDPVFPKLPPQFKEPYVTLVGGGNNWYRPVDSKLINKHGLPVSISGCLIVEGYRERTPAALATLKPMTHMSSASLLISRAMDEKHIKAKMDPKSLRRLIGWVDANGPYLGEEEIRQMPDPTPETRSAKPVPVVKPRLKTAPRINRFNIRQDGDSSRIYLNVKGAQGGAAVAGHPFVCCDIHKKQIMKVDATGQVVWTYPAELVHDLWVLPNGNILFAGPKTGVVEVTPDKKVVWTYKAERGQAVLSCQPLPNGDVMVGIQGKPSRIIEVGRDGKVKKSLALQTKGAIRLSRKTDTGTYLVAERKEKSVHEYNGDGKLIRKIAVVGNVYMAVRLENGNTLIGCGDAHTLIEIDPKDKIVWQIKENDLPGIPIRDAAGFQRLPNGNTVLCNWGGHGHLGKQAQIIEITPDKKVVWQIFDNQKFITPLHIQLLDIKGDPAKGKLYR